MWLINTKTLELCYFNNDDEVEYAILSHRWEEEEVSLQDLRDKCIRGKKGFAKIKRSCTIALRTGIQHMWIDTCCIDKTSSAELSEAINSMYRWYEQAKICYAYLSDVETTDDLAGSKWFTRGWTLQELIAPKTVKFFNRNWKSFGSKAGLQERISSITGIPTRVLRGTKPTECSVAQRMSWAAHRVTTRSEDKAYCLMGLFEVNMPLLYGEGARAFARLQEEIIKSLDDQSIFAWTGHASEYSPVLAPSPANFKHGAEIRSTSAISNPTPFSLTNVGLHIELPIMPFAMNTYLAVLQCQDMTVDKEMMPHARFNSGTTRIGILIKRTSQHRQYVRYMPAGSSIHQIDTEDYADCLKTVPILLLQQIRKLGDLNDMYGFYFRAMTSEVFGYRSGWTGWASAGDLDSDDGRSSGLRGGTYRVLCKLPETRVKELENLSHSHIAKKRDGIQILRDVQRLNLDLRFGEYGTVATFTLKNKGAKLCTSSIALLKVGFDFDFNPVSLFYGMSSKEWDSYCQSRRSCWADDRDLDKELAKYAGMDQSRCWETHGVCALRGCRILGLDVVLTHLNIHLIISEEFQDGKRKWIVDVSPLVLPFEPHYHTELNSTETTWQLYCAERMKLLQEEQVLNAKELNRRFDSRTSKADLESALQLLEDAGKRILFYQQRLHDLQEPELREIGEVREAREAIIARIAQEVREGREAMKAKETREERVARKTRERTEWKQEKEAIEARIARETREVILAMLAREAKGRRDAKEEAEAREAKEVRETRKSKQAGEARQMTEELV